MRVLIIKFGAIGDVIMLIPAAYALHRQGYAVDWVCSATVAPVLRCYPWIRVIVADERAILRGSAAEKLRGLAGLWRAVAGRRYAQVFTMYYDRRYRLLAAPVRAGGKVMLSTTDRRYKLLPGRHHTDEYARILLRLPDEVRTGHFSPVMAEGLPASPVLRTGRPRVVLVPAGARNLMRDDALRRWPAERYVELARMLLAHEVEVVLTGGPDDGWVRPLFAGLAATNLLDRIGQDSLIETLALLNEADVLVTHDTGPLHLGGITRVGIVTVFGPTDPRGRLPQRPGALAIWGGERLACRPCYDGRDFAACSSNQCMQVVSAKQVTERVLTMLADRVRGKFGEPWVELV